MMDEEELDALVRRGNCANLYDGGGHESALPEELADAITALRAQLDEANSAADGALMILAQERAEVAKLRAERDAARAQLATARADGIREAAAIASGERVAVDILALLDTPAPDPVAQAAVIRDDIAAARQSIAAVKRRANPSSSMALCQSNEA
jgi:hypothetical protein